MSPKQARILSIFLASIAIAAVILLVWTKLTIYRSNESFQKARVSATKAGIIPANPEALGAKPDPSKDFLTFYIQASFEAGRLRLPNHHHRSVDFSEATILPLAVCQQIDLQCADADQSVIQALKIQATPGESLPELNSREGLFSLSSMNYVADMLGFQVITEARSKQFVQAAVQLNMLLSMGRQVGLCADAAADQFAVSLLQGSISPFMYLLSQCQNDPDGLKALLSTIPNFQLPDLTHGLQANWQTSSVVLARPITVQKFGSDHQSIENVTPAGTKLPWVTTQWKTKYLNGLTNLANSYAHLGKNWAPALELTQDFCQTDPSRQEPQQIFWRQLSGPVFTLFQSELQTEAQWRMALALTSRIASQHHLGMPTGFDPQTDLFDPLGGSPLQVNQQKNGLEVTTPSNQYEKHGNSGTIQSSLNLFLIGDPAKAVPPQHFFQGSNKSRSPRMGL